MNLIKDLIIEDQAGITEKKVIQRQIAFEYGLFELNKIISIVGPRRAGKTYFMYQMIQHLIVNGMIQREQVVFIDFSEYRGREFDFEALLGGYFELFPSLTPWFFLDEIQEITEFRTGVLSLFKTSLRNPHVF